MLHLLSLYNHSVTLQGPVAAAVEPMPAQRTSTLLRPGTQASFTSMVNAMSGAEGDLYGPDLRHRPYKLVQVRRCCTV